MNYTEEDVERVARAIYARAMARGIDELADGWEHETAGVHDRYFDVARAALSSIPRQNVPEGWVMVPRDVVEYAYDCTSSFDLVGTGSRPSAKEQAEHDGRVWVLEELLSKQRDERVGRNNKIAKSILPAPPHPKEDK